MIDWEDKVGAPCVAAFGSDTVTFIPASGAPAFPVTGVFDNQFRATTVLEAPPASDSLPVFGVNALQFAPSAAVPTKLPPVQNDKLVFAPGSKPQSGKTYLVMEPRPDGHGIFHLALNQSAP